MPASRNPLRRACASAAVSVAVATTLLMGAAAPAAGAAANPFAGSSQAQEALHDAARDAYAALPRDIRNNPQVKGQAKALGLVETPAKPAVKPAVKSPAATAEPEARIKPSPKRAAHCPNCVALTFDDGPAASTNRLLGVLKKNDVRASFFVLGPSAQRMPKTMKRIAGHGHTIGTHGMSHSEMDKQSPAEITAEISRSTAAIQATTGKRPTWLRPPYGAMTGNVNTAARKAGMGIALWQVDTLDWKHRDPARTCRVAVGEATPGAIILMHDIHPTTVNAVQCVIDGLRAKGLEPVSLDEMIPQPTPGQVYYRR